MKVGTDLADVSLAPLYHNVHGVLEGVADEGVIILLYAAVCESRVRVVEHKIRSLGALPSAGVQHGIIRGDKPVSGRGVLVGQLAAFRVHLRSHSITCYQAGIHIEKVKI